MNIRKSSVSSKTAVNDININQQLKSIKTMEIIDSILETNSLLRSEIESLQIDQEKLKNQLELIEKEKNKTLDEFDG